MSLLTMTVLLSYLNLEIMSVLSCHNIEITQVHASIELSQLKIMPVLSYLKTISWMPVIMKCENKLNKAILNAATKNVKNDC